MKVQSGKRKKETENSLFISSLLQRATTGTIPHGFMYILEYRNVSLVGCLHIKISCKIKIFNRIIQF